MKVVMVFEKFEKILGFCSDGKVRRWMLLFVLLELVLYRGLVGFFILFKFGGRRVLGMFSFLFVFKL